MEKETAYRVYEMLVTLIFLGIYLYFVVTVWWRKIHRPKMERVLLLLSFCLPCICAYYLVLFIGYAVFIPWPPFPN